MFLESIPAGPNPPGEMNVLIEVPLGGEPVKYEFDKNAGILVVDRFLYTPMRYPGNYGFIPHTLSGDGDPCDVIVAASPAVLAGTLMSCNVVGVLHMRDEAGIDEKIVAVPSAHLIGGIQCADDYTDLPEVTLRQIEHFFCHYKDLDPGKWVKIERWGNAAEARRIVAEAIERAKRSNGAPRGRG
jgi:inorganic pyrophosphatase